MMLQNTVRDFLLQYDVLDETDNSVRIAVEIASIAAKEGSVFLCSCLAVLIRENRKLKKEVNCLLELLSSKEPSYVRNFSHILNSQTTKPMNSGKTQHLVRNAHTIDSLSSSYNATPITLPHKNHDYSSTSSGYSTASKENEQTISRKFWNKSALIKVASTSDRKRLRGSRRSYRKASSQYSSDSNYLSEFSQDQENILGDNSTLNFNHVGKRNLKESFKQSSSHDFPLQDFHQGNHLQSKEQIPTLAEVSLAPLNAESFPSEKSSCYSEEDLDTIYAPYPLAGCGCDICLEMIKDPHQPLYHLDSDGSSILKPGNKVIVLSSEFIIPQNPSKLDLKMKSESRLRYVCSDEKKLNSELVETDHTPDSHNFEDDNASSDVFYPNGCQTSNNETEESCCSLPSDATSSIQKQIVATVLYFGHRRTVVRPQNESLLPSTVGVVALYPDGSEHFVPLIDVLDEYSLPPDEMLCTDETVYKKVPAPRKVDSSSDFEDVKNVEECEEVIEAFNLNVCCAPLSDEESQRQRCQSESVLYPPNSMSHSSVSLRRSESVSINIYPSDDNTHNLEDEDYFPNNCETHLSEFSMSKFLKLYIGRKSDVSGFGNCPVFV